MRRSAVSRAHPALESDVGVCAAGDAREADAGAAMLEAGGNAIDAAVAAAFAAFVVEQQDCGLGGFAHVSVRDGESGALLSFDGYVRAPGGARPDMFRPVASEERYFGHPSVEGEKARFGPAAPAVPGAVSALCRAHARCGRLPLSECLAPAIALAEAGVAFTWRDALAIAAHQDRIRELPETAAVLLPGGRIPRLPVQLPDGDRMDTGALAATLGRIAASGEEGFYRGPVAEAIGRFVRGKGGILGAEDLASYRPRVVREAPGRYRGLEYVSCLDPIAYEALGILEGFDLAGAGARSFAYRHLMAEALGVAFTDCLTHYGDPDFTDSPVVGLSSPAFAAARRAQITMERALPRPIAAGDPRPFDDPARAPALLERGPQKTGRGGTTQIVAADREGNAVSIVTAIGWTYGSLVYVPEAGVFLNNGMHYFDPRPGRPASIAPGKMPMFGAPALVASEGGAFRFAAAGSGGYRIEGGVLHALTGVLDHGMDVSAAVDHPRVHCQGQKTYVDSRVSAEIVARLEAAGHPVTVLEEDASTWHFARICAVTRDPARGTLSASGGPPWLTALAAPG